MTCLRDSNTRPNTGPMQAWLRLIHGHSSIRRHNPAQLQYVRPLNSICQDRIPHIVPAQTRFYSDCKFPLGIASHILTLYLLDNNVLGDSHALSQSRCSPLGKRTLWDISCIPPVRQNLDSFLLDNLWEEHFLAGISAQFCSVSRPDADLCRSHCNNIRCHKVPQERKVRTYRKSSQADRLSIGLSLWLGG